MNRLLILWAVSVCFGCGVGNTETFSDRLDALTEFQDSMQEWNSLRFDAEVISELISHNGVVLYDGEFVKNGNKLLYDHTRFAGNSLEICRNNSAESIDVGHVRMIRVGGQSYMVSGLGDTTSLQQTIASDESWYTDTPGYAFQRLENMLEAFQVNALENPAWLAAKPVEEEGGLLTYRLTWDSESSGYANIYIIKFDSNSNGPLPVMFQFGTLNRNADETILNSELALELNENSPLKFDRFIAKTYKPEIENILLAQLWGWFEFKQNFKLSSRWTMTVFGDVEVNGPVFPEEMQFVIPKGESLIVYDFTQDDTAPKVFEAAERQVVTP